MAIVAHVATLWNGFAYDDRKAVILNPVVKRAALDVGALVGTDFWGRPPGQGPGTWRPLAVLSLWADRRVGGGEPWAYHLTNVLLHAGAAAAFAWAVRRRTGQPRLALAAGLIFAAMAVNTEAVAGIVGRADMMAAGFAFLCWGARGAAGAAAAAAAGMLCKESAVIVPIAVWLADVCLAPDGARPRPWDRRYLAIAGAVASALAVRSLLFAPPGAVRVADSNNPLVDEALPVRIWTAFRLLVLALRLVLVPLNLSADYSYAEVLPEPHPGSLEVLAGAGALALLAGGAWALRRRAPAAAAGIVWFLVPWAFVSNVFFALPTILAERLLYLPAAGAALALGTLVSAALERRGRVAAAALAVPLVVGNLALSIARDRDWRDDLALFGAAVETSPRSARAWNNYGAALYRAGRPQEALVALGRALEIAPAWAAPNAFTGIVLDELGRPEEAEPYLRRAVRLAPGDQNAVFNYALFLARHGRYGEAVAVLRPFVAAHPEEEREAALLGDLERSLQGR